MPAHSVALRKKRDLPSSFVQRVARSVPSQSKARVFSTARPLRLAPARPSVVAASTRRSIRNFGRSRVMARQCSGNSRAASALQVLEGRQARRLLEAADEVARAHAELVRERLEADLLPVA